MAPRGRLIKIRQNAKELLTMKKVLRRVINLLILFISITTITFAGCSFAEEIRFQDIQWASDVFTLERELDKFDLIGIQSKEWTVPYCEEQINQAVETLLGCAIPTDKMCGFRTSGLVLDIGDGKLFEGYNLKAITGYSVFGEKDGMISKSKPDSELFYVRVDLYDDDVDSMYEKLISLYTERYGEPHEQWGTAQCYDEKNGFVANCDMVQKLFSGDNDTHAAIEEAIYKGSSQWVCVLFWKGGYDSIVSRINQSVGDT